MAELSPSERTPQQAVKDFYAKSNPRYVSFMAAGDVLKALDGPLIFDGVTISQEEYVNWVLNEGPLSTEWINTLHARGDEVATVEASRNRLSTLQTIKIVNETRKATYAAQSAGERGGIGAELRDLGRRLSNIEQATQSTAATVAKVFNPALK